MPNHLARESSPYLRQHADNPVDWRPWGEEAFAKARGEQKPIFLSIGYSTCHWCHVMAHESFENAETAALLNEHFVPVKVDREERPDVDRVYMSYVQGLTGHGGWPLSAWLTPDLKPFFGGTYFPPADYAGRPGFPGILRAVARGWREDRDKLVAEAERSLAALRAEQAEGEGSGPLEAELIEERLSASAADAFGKGFRYFQQSYDASRGGFGQAPKFPRASNLSFLFRCAAIRGHGDAVGREASAMAVRTLQHMARGGIHDHVGGGFHRYSVDADWFVPHFEKMLYDQAQIALNAIEGWQSSGDERLAWLARDILDYALRILAPPGGGFASAEDADSPLPEDPKRHSEGAFYLWTSGELDAALGHADALFVSSHFGAAPGGNVPAERDPHGEFTGKNILAQARPLSATASEFQLDAQQASDRLASCLERLRSVRASRPRPGLDDKVLTAWNGLMISALAAAAAAPAESLADRRGAYRAAAVRAAEFIERERFDSGSGSLFRSSRGGGGFAEDYALFIQGLLDLYEAAFDIRWLKLADRLQSSMDAKFWDEARGGYFNSPAGAPDIVLRMKEDYDGAEPAPNSVAAMNLLRLGAMLGEPGRSAGAGQPSRRERALRTLEAFRPRWGEHPQALPQMLCALEVALEPPRHVVLAGDPGAPDFQALAAALREGLGKRRSVLAADGGPAQAWLAKRAPWMVALLPVDGKAAAYLCEEFTCQAPVVDPGRLREALAG